MHKTTSNPESMVELPFECLLETNVSNGTFFLERMAHHWEIHASGITGGRIVAGRDGGFDYVVSKGPIAFDENGFPYYYSTFYDKRIRVYHRTFLGNFQFVMGLGRIHENTIESIRTRAMNESEIVRKRYSEFVTHQEEEIARAMNKRKLVEYGRVKERSDLEKGLAEVGAGSLDSAQIGDFEDTREAKIFRVWYVNYLKCTGYEKKITETDRLEAEIFHEYMTHLIKRLKSTGFKSNGFRIV